ncbi:hypothetical protein FQR65_LT19374 [Abscondita terminalis]|nr:hypothetical protein FQR65_LT19374 [Abscondita terminalis]
MEAMKSDQPEVREDYIKAQYIRPNEAVWEDSCVEFFVSFDQKVHYYNIEMNPLGTGLVGYGTADKDSRSRLTAEQIQQINTYTEDIFFTNLDLQQLETVLLHAPEGLEVHYIINDLEEQNWNKLWESNFNPIVVDDQCYVRATFHEPKEQYPYEIIIDPKMSFGTGHHQTTSMMLSFILENTFQGKEVLDMGCGTGILAILASFRGATHVFAVDYDPICIDSVEENKILNQVSNIESQVGSYEAEVSCIIWHISISIRGIRSWFRRSDVSLPEHGFLEAHTVAGRDWLVSGEITSDIDAVILGMHAAGETRRVAQPHRNWILRSILFLSLFTSKTNHLPSMIMHVLKTLKRSFDYLVGAQLEGFDGLVNLTTDNPVIIIEGDEYYASTLDHRSKFHLYHPNIALISNVEWDNFKSVISQEDYYDQFRIL